MENLKSTTNMPGISKQRAYFIWMCISRHIKIFWPQPQQEIPYATADEKSPVTCAGKSLHHFKCIDADVFGGDRHTSLIVKMDCR
jgi:hypothetical protein